MLKTNEVESPLVRLFDRLASIGRAMQRVRRRTIASNEGHQAQNLKVVTDVVPKYVDCVDVFSGAGGIFNSRQGQDTLERRGYLTSAGEVGQKGKAQAKALAKKRKLSERVKEQSAVGISYNKNGSEGGDNLLLTKN